MEMQADTTQAMRAELAHIEKEIEGLRARMPSMAFDEFEAAIKKLRVLELRFSYVRDHLANANAGNDEHPGSVLGQ